MAQSTLVIGAGIIGSAMAWQLAESGCTVTLVDPSDTGGAASGMSLGWTNATYENPRFYYELRRFSMERWDALKATYPDLPYRQNGTLYTSFYGTPLQTVYDEHTPWGYPMTWVSAAQMAELEPHLAVRPERGLVCPVEGHVAPHEAAIFFRGLALGAGAQFKKTRALSVLREGDKIIGVRTENENLLADTTVLAAGRHADTLARTVDVELPMTAPPGLLIHTKPAPSLINRTILTEDLHMAQWPDGTITAGGDFGGGAVNDDPDTGAQILFERLQKALSNGAALQYSHHTVGLRPTPQDGFPVIGSPLQGLYLTVMHSGATLAPAVGALATDEITTGQRHALLDPFHPNRFANTWNVECV
ncbi:NAD(P)/FAD-dependent oxidoreductase [Neptunicoccus cionae]|uniref:NAD(P)/FAD-dependent oxidoreductase n=1 Tax=Neptunicoccus cionae TaxID=2035344 RepID=UPI000C77A3E3|nr:FAD-dependent oxidoreductase [Amylibacter cionae]PLS23079.1 D-amino-acid oxidase [Amylibacter cionae]